MKGNNMKYRELLNEMRKFNDKHGIKRKVCDKYKEDGTLIKMVGMVVLSNNMLNREYTKEERTYTFNNYNKALTSSDLGYSIFAHCEYDGDMMRIENLHNDDIEFAEIIEVIE